MTIQYAILGYLSWHPFTGYDLKKLFAESDYFYWSGNNNQIYKTLVLLQKEGLVRIREEKQGNYPTRKIYTITEAGLMKLKMWILSEPQLPELRNPFFIRLAWSDLLDAEELSNLLSMYEKELIGQLAMFAEKQRRGIQHPARSKREEFLWKMLAKNWTANRENELAWIRELRYQLSQKWSDNR